MFQHWLVYSLFLFVCGCRAVKCYNVQFGVYCLVVFFIRFYLCLLYLVS